MKVNILAIAIGLGLLPAALPAQTPAPEKEGQIAQRRENQQRRIVNGVRSGQLTAGDTARLEKKESALNKEVRADRAAHGGRLSGAEKKQIENRQNRVSRDIYKDKHNRAAQQY